MALITYDVSDVSDFDSSPTEGRPAPLPSWAKLRLWTDNLRMHDEARAFLAERALTEETVANRLLGASMREDVWGITIPILHGNGSRVELKTLKWRELPPERDPRQKYRAAAGRGIHLYPWPVAHGPVWVCAGEWDQMNLEQAGLNAVTSTGGADPRGWPDEWLVLFSGRDVRVVMDRGEEAFAEALARRLARQARSARVVYLRADLPVKTDISDLARDLGSTGLRAFLCKGRSN